MFAPLMVLLEIDATGLAVFEFERNAPRSIDVDRIAFRIEPLQGMKVEARDVHFLSADGDVEPVEPRENTLAHFRIDLRTPALRPQLRKGFALEGSDHKLM
jgi:hypothetical protein